MGGRFDVGSVRGKTSAESFEAQRATPEVFVALVRTSARCALSDDSDSWRPPVVMAGLTEDSGSGGVVRRKHGPRSRTWRGIHLPLGTEQDTSGQCHAHADSEGD